MIYLILNYSRSGGTLLSKLIASQENVVFLSEVNPTLNAVTSPAQQAVDWFDFEVKSGDFTYEVQQIAQHSANQGKYLIVRDFSLINFTAHQLNGYKPSKNFEIVSKLKTIDQVKIIGFVRNAIDVWISRECPPHFSKGYHNFVKQLISLNIPVFKYENLCANPSKELNKIAEYWKIDGWKYTDELVNYKKVTGDNLLKIESRGGGLKKPEVLKRKRISRSNQRRLRGDVLLHEANSLLGYSTDYNENLEDASQWMVEMKAIIRNLKGSKRITH